MMHPNYFTVLGYNKDDGSYTLILRTARVFQTQRGMQGTCFGRLRQSRLAEALTSSKYGISTRTGLQCYPRRGEANLWERDK